MFMSRHVSLHPSQVPRPTVSSSNSNFPSALLSGSDDDEEEGEVEWRCPGVILCPYFLFYLFFLLNFLGVLGSFGFDGPRGSGCLTSRSTPTSFDVPGTKAQTVICGRA